MHDAWSQSIEAHIEGLDNNDVDYEEEEEKEEQEQA
jgi:hypothetical protein